LSGNKIQSDIDSTLLKEFVANKLSEGENLAKTIKAINEPYYVVGRPRAIAKVNEESIVKGDFSNAKTIGDEGDLLLQVREESPRTKQIKAKSSATLISALEGAKAEVVKSVKPTPVNEILGNEPSIKIPDYLGGVFATQSQYHGKGVYEQSQFYGVSQKAINQENALIYGTRNVSNTKQNNYLKEILRLNQVQDLSLNQDLSLEQTQNLKLTQNLSLEQNQALEQTQNLDLQQSLDLELELELQLQTQNPVTTFGYPTRFPQENDKDLGDININNNKSKVKNKVGTPGYDVFVKEKGRFNFKAGNLPKGRALLLGEDYTLAELSRTFEIQPSGRNTKQKDILNRVNEQLFRDYKIKGGKAVPLYNTYIERNALSSRSEVDALHRAKKEFKYRHILD
jgi:hypothetical protein